MPSSSSQVSELRAVAHPIRLQILSLLTAAPMSATEVARELSITHANASYHLRVLREAGQLIEDGEERIRGGIAKRYRHAWKPSSRPNQPPPSTTERAVFVRAMAERMVQHHQARVPNPGHLTDAELWVTPEVVDQVRELLDRASDLLHGSAQAPRTGGARRMNLTIGFFEMAQVIRGDQ